MGKGVFKSIDRHDINITPFKAYKSWAFESVADLTALNIDRYQAIKPNKAIFSGGTVTLDTAETLLDSSSLYYNVIDDRPAAIHWYGLNNLYYKQLNKRYQSYGISDETHIRYLYDNAAILSLPQKRIGERIKPGSVRIQYEASSLYSSTVELIDDGKGNLIDTALSSSISNQLLYLGFNSMTYDVSASNNNVYYDIVVDSIIPDLKVLSKNTYIVPKIMPSGSVAPWGNSAKIGSPGNGYIRIPDHTSFNFNAAADYAISFWIGSVDSTTSDTNVPILTKRASRITSFQLPNQTIETSNVVRYRSQYPFDLTWDTLSNDLKFRCASGADIAEINGSVDIKNEKHNIILQKTGSVLEVYIDGASIGTASVPNGNIHNSADVFIGAVTAGASNFDGYVDEFFIFSKALTQSEIDQLAYVTTENLMSTNTNIVGNVIYDHGIIIISDPRPKYGTSEQRLFNDVLYNTETSSTLPSILDSFYFEYKSTVKLYEHEYLVRLRGDEFNFTSNPTIRINDDLQSELPKTFVANTEFAPYITTIGLYNDKGQLLAIGKLGTPIKKREDVDLTFVIKFDS